MRDESLIRDRNKIKIRQFYQSQFNYSNAKKQNLITNSPLLPLDTLLSSKTKLIDFNQQNKKPIEIIKEEEEVRKNKKEENLVI